MWIDDNSSGFNQIPESEQTSEITILSQQTSIPERSGWDGVRKRIKTASMALMVVSNNVPANNKMGVYTWDELALSSQEFVMAVCLQVGIGDLVPQPFEENKMIRQHFYEKSDGFDSKEIPGFTFIEHRPEAFGAIRSQFSVPSATYCASLGLTSVKHKPNLRYVSQSDASGKSSSWFFFSSDMRYAIKTCSKSDLEALTGLLNGYSEHVKSSTLLPKFYGLYTIKIDSLSVTFLVMNNVFAGYLTIHQRFDLKGSTHGRKASEKERKKDHCVYKDLDFVETLKVIPLGQRVYETAIRDAKWLGQSGVMDYSLLLGIHYKKSNGLYTVPDNQKKLCENINHKKAHPGVVYIENDELVVYIGIVDILTKYSFKKRLETLFTGKLFCRNVSAQSPKFYAKRFQNYISKISDKNDKVVVFGL
eukprot:c20911_g3_i1.p1 GENE.c20911_g3_i1~~c20911_g3_i1.p1  ORF type:complete len:419 (+),score=162.48 c20911_g3_i1:10-1266(+)